MMCTGVGKRRAKLEMYECQSLVPLLGISLLGVICLVISLHWNLRAKKINSWNSLAQFTSGSCRLPNRSLMASSKELTLFLRSAPCPAPPTAPSAPSGRPG